MAKNYLNVEELDALNRIVSLYLDFAELQAKSRKPMHMQDWIAKLDDFLRLSERKILSHAGKISHDVAIATAEAEYDQYQVKQLEEPSKVEKDFEAALDKVKKLQDKKPQKKSGRKKKK